MTSFQQRIQGRVWGVLRAGVQLAGILALLHSCFDLKAMLGGKHPYVLYYLAAAMRPRMLMTVDPQGKLLPVSVRVGQAIDTVAQVTMISRGFPLSGGSS